MNKMQSDDPITMTLIVSGVVGGVACFLIVLLGIIYKCLKKEEAYNLTDYNKESPYLLL